MDSVTRPEILMTMSFRRTLWLMYYTVTNAICSRSGHTPHAVAQFSGFLRSSRKLWRRQVWEPHWSWKTSSRSW